MSFIQNIRFSLSEMRLRKLAESNSRKKIFVNYEDAKSLAIIFDATPDGNLESVKKLVAAWKERRKTVKAIGFFDQKFTPVNISYAKADFDFFNLKELNPLHFPSSPYIRTFADEPYDLLLDLNLHNKFPLRSIAILSRASCKVGINTRENLEIHDLLIAAAKDATVASFISEAERCLRMINR